MILERTSLSVVVVLSSPVATYLASLAPSGRRMIRTRLRAMAEFFNQELETAPWGETRYHHVRLYLNSMLANGYAPATINQWLSGIRGIARECWKLGAMPHESYEQIRAVPNVRGSRPLAGRAISGEEFSKLLEVAENSRDRALLLLLHQTGLRRSEVSALDWEHYRASDGLLLVVAGKGNKVREVYVTGGTKSALEGIMRSEGPLFRPFGLSGDEKRGRLSPSGIAWVVSRLCRRAGIGKCSPHDFRRTTAGDMLSAGVDLSTVQDVLGHASPVTTARYDRRGDERKQRAAEAIE